MRPIIIALATLAASAFLPAVAGAECLPSSEAVFAAHPHAVHASWEGRSHHGRRCWYEDGERHRISRDTARPDGDMRRTAGLADGRSARGSGEQPATATNLAARSPVPRQRSHTAPPIRTVPIDETAPHWPETTEVAPPPIPCTSIGNTDFCAAARAYVVANADTLDRHRREAMGVSIAVIEDYLARETVR